MLEFGGIFDKKIVFGGNLTFYAPIFKPTCFYGPKKFITLICKIYIKNQLLIKKLFVKVLY